MTFESIVSKWIRISNDILDRNIKKLYILHLQGYILENTPSRAGGYQPMSFGGKKYEKEKRKGEEMQNKKEERGRKRENIKRTREKKVKG
jgi:hypothetical protein